MSDDQLSTKFLSQARGVLPDDRAKELLDACWGIRAQADITRILALGALK